MAVDILLRFAKINKKFHTFLLPDKFTVPECLVSSNNRQNKNLKYIYLVSSMKPNGFKPQ